MVRRLFLVRHGPTHQSAFTGWRDVPADLSDTASIARMQDHLPSEASVVSSDLQRCVATADAITGARCRLPHDARLREFHFGDWDGMEFRAAAARDPHLSRAFWEDPGDAAPPGGESWNTVTARVGTAITQHMEAQDGDLIVVAHLGAILCHIGATTGQSPRSLIDQMIDPLSVSELHHSPTGWALAAINHTP